MENRVILELRNINKEFPGTKALSNITLSFLQGEVHALVGENGAGKSTMMNIIGGVFPPTSGTFLFNGEEIQHLTPMLASKIGIGFVHQETSLCPHVSVAENIFIGHIPKKAGGLVDFQKLYADCSAVLKRFRCNFTPETKVGELSVAEQQIVEISKALALHCKLLILDEPTASLTNQEVEELFHTVRQLKKEGVTILYISHRLSEVFELCDRVTVLRDGCIIGSRPVSEIDADTMIRMMVGRKLENLYPQKSGTAGEELLRVEQLSGNRFQNISFCLNRGEILGFSGLVGAGRSELMRTLCGIDRKTSGQVSLLGKPLHISSYRECLDQGLVYMTEDRKSEGLFLEMSVRENLVASVICQINRLLVQEERTDKLSKKYIDYLNIKVSSSQQLCGDLSGGNQQKVLLGKSLAIQPKVLIVDEPTRGIDVGAKFEVYKLLRTLCEQGIGIILVSSDLPEIIGMCDRVAVMYEGRMSGELSGSEITEEHVMQLAAAISEV